MKKLLLAMAASLAFSTVYAQDFEQGYVQSLAHSINFVNQNSEKVWPGFSIHSPIAVHFYGPGHSYAFNFSPLNPHWQKLNIDNLSVHYLDTDEYQFGKDMTPDIYISRTSASIDGQETFLEIYNLLSMQEDDIDLKNQNIFLIADEFRKFIPDLTFPIYDGFNDLRNVKLFYFELAALQQYLSHNGHDAENFLHDAIAIHQYRTSLLNKNALTYENLKQVDKYDFYVGFKSLNDDDAFKKSILNGFDLHCSFKEAPDQIQYEIQMCMIWLGSYDLTSIYGLALDNQFPDGSWKRNAITNLKASSQILQDSYHMSDANAESIAKSAMLNPIYNYDKTERYLDQYFKAYLDEMAAEIATYQNNPGVELQLKWAYFIYPFNGEVVDDAEKIYEINTQEQLLKNVKIDAHSDFGDELHYQNVNLVYINYDLDRLKISPSSMLVIDGKTQSVGSFLAEKKSVHFHQLQLDDTVLKIKFKSLPGVISSVDGVIKLLPDENRKVKLLDHRKIVVKNAFSLPKKIDVGRKAVISVRSIIGI